MKKIARPAALSETERVKRLQAGDSAAIECWVGEHHSTLVNVAAAIVGDRFAEEVAQDAWMSAIKALSNFEGRSSLKTWLVQICVNTARSRAQRENRYVSLEAMEESGDSPLFDRRGHWQLDRIQWHAETPEDLLNTAELAQLMQQALDSLPANQRAVLTLIDIEGMDKSDVCNILAIQASHLRVLLHRARTRLYQVVNEHQETI